MTSVTDCEATEWDPKSRSRDRMRQSDIEVYGGCQEKVKTRSRRAPKIGVDFEEERANNRRATPGRGMHATAFGASSETADLGPPLDKKLRLYALAAGATGVSALALAPPADAKIVYTKANIPILVNQPFSLDVNHDGVSDFMIWYRVTGYGSGYSYTKWAGIRESGFSPDVVVVNQSGHFGYAAALPPNVPVWKKRRFGSCVQTLAVCTFNLGVESGSDTTARGPWRNVKSPYLGMKFSISGQIHYGWARLNITLNKRCDFVITLTGYAYETIPNKLILTGHTKGPNGDMVPGSLGHLAEGVQVKRVAAPAR